MQSLLGGTRVKMAFQRTLSDSLFTPVDAASLAVIRIGFGSIMLLEMLRYFYMDWIRYYYITPEFHFSYYGFDWVQPWSGIGMYLHFAGLALLAFLSPSAFCSASAASPLRWVLPGYSCLTRPST